MLNEQSMYEFLLPRLFCFLFLLPFTAYMFIGLPMIAGFVHFSLPFTNSNTFHVNTISVYSIGVCNKKMLDLI